MNHEMRLHEGPFNRINSGIKTVEYRLNDEKRRQIKVNDTITFYKRPEEVKTIKVKVVELRYYNTLLDMYTDTFEGYLNNMYKSPQAVVDDTPYYTEEEVKKYGCVAIFFEKIG